MWFELSGALSRNGQKTQALEALEASLRVDDTNVEAWLVFAGLARECGNLDLSKEAAEVAKKLAPDDSRVLEFIY